MNNQKQCTDGQLGDTGLTVIISCHGEGGVAANFSRSEECTPPYLRNAAPLPREGEDERERGRERERTRETTLLLAVRGKREPRATRHDVCDAE